MLRTWDEESGLLHHETNESDDVQASESSIALIVFDETSARGGPGESAFNHPPAWQQYEAALGFGRFDHLEGDPMLRGCGGRAFARVALVYIGEFDALIGRSLDPRLRLAPS